MVKIEIEHPGGRHSVAVHTQSGSRLQTAGKRCAELSRQAKFKRGYGDSGDVLVAGRFVKKLLETSSNLPYAVESIRVFSFGELSAVLYGWHLVQ
jgi:hypothetical protein